MKAITIKQPWASLIVEGKKDIENRTWKTNFRGRVLIHAGVTIDNNAVDKISCFDGELARKVWFDINDNKMPTGAIIGSVEIVDCVVNHPSKWAQHKAIVKRKINGKNKMVEVPVYNWVLANPILFLEPIPAKGKLSFWDSPIVSFQTELT